MAIDFVGVTHVALELSSPTRMERYLRDTFGLQLLRVGYWKGEYVRVMGSPHHQLENPGFLWLYNRPFIPRGRLRHVAFGVRDRGVDSVVGELRDLGYEDIDDEDILEAPGGLRIKFDSFTHPQPIPVGDPTTKMVEAEVDMDLPCMVRNIHHVAIDMGDPPSFLEWIERVSGIATSHGDRRGDLFSKVRAKGEKDVLGRPPSLLPIVRRPSIEGSQLNHIAFDMPDAEAAIGEIESRGSKVDLAQDAIIHGPEEIWYQIDSRDTPFPRGHLANDFEVVLDRSPKAWRFEGGGEPITPFARRKKS